MDRPSYNTLFIYYMVSLQKLNFNEISAVLLGVIKIFNKIKLSGNLLIEMVIPPSPPPMEEKVQENRFLMVRC